MAPGGEEGRGRLRKAAGRRERPLIRGCPNGWIVSDANGNEIVPSDDNTIVMPNSDVTIEAIFRTPNYFGVIVGEADNCSVTIFNEAREYLKGSTIYFELHPVSGEYVLEELATAPTTGDLPPIRPTWEHDYVYSFNMPESNVGIMARFTLTSDPTIEYINYERGRCYATDNFGNIIHSAPAGSRVTLGNIPNEGFVFSRWIVTDANGNEIIPYGDNTFVMPSTSVTIQAIFRTCLTLKKVDTNG